jgi:hypothetical protein
VLVLKELEVLKRARGLVGYIVGSGGFGSAEQAKERSLDMAEVAGSNPAEPIVLFTIGYVRAVHWTFNGNENFVNW